MLPAAMQPVVMLEWGERVHYRGLTDETSSCDPFICFRGCAFILWHADGQIIATLSGRESEKIKNKLMI